MLLLAACGKKTYEIDYCGQEGLYDNAVSSCRAGDEVTLVCTLMATDTDYSFFLDEEELDYSVDLNGMEIRFEMPAHDVKLECRTTNSLAHESQRTESWELTYESFDGGGPEYSVKIEDDSIVSYTTSRVYKSQSGENAEGSGYYVIIAFTGLKPGTTRVTVSARSSIADNFDDIYAAEVDENLNVQLLRYLSE